MLFTDCIVLLRRTARKERSEVRLHVAVQGTIYHGNSHGAT